MRPGTRNLSGLNFLSVILIASCATTAVYAQDAKDKPTHYPVDGHVYKPRKAKPDESFVSSLKVPDGFKISVFDEGLSNTRVLTVGDKEGKRLYVTRREQGDCLLLRDENKDGKADGDPVTVATAPQLHGIAVRDNKAWLVSVKEVMTADIKPDGTFGPLKTIIRDLPDGGQHPNRTIALSPAGDSLFISVGSTCNACKETNKESATMLKASVDGTTRTIYATGLRNTIGFDWHPKTGHFWGADHGVDWLGDDSHKEELNRLEEGKFYGWPFILGEGMRNPQDEPPPGVTIEALESSTTLPAATYVAHSAPMQMQFYKGGTFPDEFDGDAFITMRGSWNRSKPSGYEIARIRFNDAGQPEKWEPFITGFVKQEGDGWAEYGRLMGLAIPEDGSAIFVADDRNGVIYKITPEGN